MEKKISEMSVGELLTRYTQATARAQLDYKNSTLLDKHINVLAEIQMELKRRCGESQ